MIKMIRKFGKLIKEAPVIAVSFIIWGVSILLMLTAVSVAYWSHYERAVYEKEEYPANVVRKDIRGLDDLRTPPIREEDYDSYAEYINAIFERWSDASEILDGEYEPEYFSFEIDVANLKPTGFYLEGYQFSHPSTGNGGVGRTRRTGTTITSSYGPPEYTWSWLEMLFYRKNSIYTQLYSLKLADGNTVLVRLSDTVIDIPKTGKLEIPVATWTWLCLGDSISRGTDGDVAEEKLAMRYWLEKDSSGSISYIDASDWWLGYNSDLIELCEKRENIFLGMIISGLCGLPIGFVVLLIGGALTNKKKGK